MTSCLSIKRGVQAHVTQAYATTCSGCACGLVLGQNNDLLCINIKRGVYNLCNKFALTQLYQSQEQSLPLQVPIYSWLERINCSQLSCSGTQVTRPGFEPYAEQKHQSLSSTRCSYSLSATTPISLCFTYTTLHSYREAIIIIIISVYLLYLCTQI